MPLLKRLRAPRMTVWTLISFVLLMGLTCIAPEQLRVVLYKACLVTLAAVVGYWIDRALFVEGRPHACHNATILVGAWIRRALITLACILGMTLGL